jgi:peptide/nickel transport system permease protein
MTLLRRHQASDPSQTASGFDLALHPAGPTRSGRRPTDNRIRRLIVQRLALAPVILLGVSFAVFVMIDLSPNDPAFAQLGQFADAESRARFARENGLDAPLLVRYGQFLVDLVQLDFGASAIRAEPVSTLIARALPLTIQLVGLSIAIAIVLSCIFGTLAAVTEGGWTDRVISGSMAMIQAAPSFWIGLIVIQLFAISLGVIPAGGYVRMSEGLAAWFQSIIGPAVVLALGIMAALTRIVRASLAEELAKDYVRTAVGAGLSRPRVLFRNVFPNALIAPITVLGIWIGALMSGAVLVEVVFNLPGMGNLLVTGVAQGDLGVVRAVAIVGAVAFVLSNLAVDLLYLAIKPRATEEAGR